MKYMPSKQMSKDDLSHTNRDENTDTNTDANTGTNTIANKDTDTNTSVHLHERFARGAGASFAPFSLRPRGGGK